MTDTTTTNIDDNMNAETTKAKRTRAPRKAKAAPVQEVEVIEVDVNNDDEGAYCSDTEEIVNAGLIADIDSVRADTVDSEEADAAQDENSDKAAEDAVNAQAELDAAMQKVRELIIRLKIEDKVDVQMKQAPKSSPNTSTGVKGEYTVTLSNDETITFKSSDAKSAKYRAYRIAKDGSKTRKAGLKVKNLVDHESNEVK